MHTNPNETFVTNTITRKEIVSHLNRFLESKAHKERFSNNDQRLTSGVCHRFAVEFGSIVVVAETSKFWELVEALCSRTAMEFDIYAA